MADRTITIVDASSGHLIPIKLHDNGDSTYSLVVNGLAPGSASHILTEAGDFLTTEAGDQLITET